MKPSPSLCGALSAATKTGETLGAALNAIDTLVAPKKERLVNEVWGAVDPAMAATLTAYAEAAQPTVWQSSPAFFSDWTSEQVERTIGSLCVASQLSLRQDAWTPYFN
jgi:hypothetical protein